MRVDDNTNTGGTRDATGFDYNCSAEKTPSDFNASVDKQFNKTINSKLTVKGG